MTAALGSRFMARLEASLRATRDPVEIACLRVERAGFLARQGRFDDAQAELGEIHAQFDRRPVAPVSVWLCIADGWVAHYTSRSEVARDKMKRALALSAAARLTRLQALSAAWLAHVEFTFDDMEGMAQHVAQALQLAAADDHAARARACMVVAISYHFARRPDLAQPWYAKSRKHALVEGDDSTLSALGFNIAGHRCTHALQASIFGERPEDARFALAGVASTDNFDLAAGNAAFEAVRPVIRAFVLSAQGDHAVALAIYESNVKDAEAQGLAHMRCVLLADMAWCRLHAGDAPTARAEAQAAAACIHPSTFVEDRAMAHGRLAQVHDKLGDAATASGHRQQALAAWAEHEAMQQRVLALLDAALVPVMPPVTPAAPPAS